MKRFFKVISNSYKYYLPIHLIPLLIFKRKKLMSEPIKTLKSTIINYLKSLCFMGAYVAILKYGLCKFKNIRGKIDGMLKSTFYKYIRMEPCFVSIFCRFFSDFRA